MPGEVVSIGESELHDAYRPQLNAGPQELASQLSVANHLPLPAFGKGCHDGRMMYNLHQTPAFQHGLTVALPFPSARKQTIKIFATPVWLDSRGGNKHVQITDKQ